MCTHNTRRWAPYAHTHIQRAIRMCAHRNIPVGIICHLSICQVVWQKKNCVRGQFEGYPLPHPARTYMAINMKFIYDYYITFRRAPKTMRICAVPAVTMIAIRIVTNWLKGMWGLSNNDLYLRNGNCADTKTHTLPYTSHTPALFVGCNAIVCCTAHVLFSIYNI